MLEHDVQDNKRGGGVVFIAILLGGNNIVRYDENPKFYVILRS